MLNDVLRAIIAPEESLKYVAAMEKATAIMGELGPKFDEVGTLTAEEGKRAMDSLYDVSLCAVEVGDFGVSLEVAELLSLIGQYMEADSYTVTFTEESKHTITKES